MEITVEKLHLSHDQRSLHIHHASVPALVSYTEGTHCIGYAKAGIDYGTHCLARR